MAGHVHFPDRPVGLGGEERDVGVLQGVRVEAEEFGVLCDLRLQGEDAVGDAEFEEVACLPDEARRVAF